MSKTHLELSTHKISLYRQLGSGTYGTVYCGSLLPTQPRGKEHKIAVKMIRNATHRKDAEARFIAESRIHARLSEHENVVTLFGSDAATLDDMTSCYCLCMELSPVGDLGHFMRRWLRKSNNLPFAEPTVAGMALQLCRGLDFIHANHILHGDIKPDNILVFWDHHGDMVLKYSDFGLSMSMDDRTPYLADHVGSLHYSAPEFYTHAKWYTIWSRDQDYYALGVTCASLVGVAIPDIEPYLMDAPGHISTNLRMSQRQDVIFYRLASSVYSTQASCAVAALLSTLPEQRSMEPMCCWAKGCMSM